jgi:hypothetical protein
MPSHQPHPTTTTSSSYRVLVADHVTPGLASGDGRRYESPPQSEQQARSLLAVLVGDQLSDHHGPWRQAIAGGQRIIELRAEP